MRAGRPAQRNTISTAAWAAFYLAMGLSFGGLISSFLATHTWIYAVGTGVLLVVIEDTEGEFDCPCNHGQRHAKTWDVAPEDDGQDSPASEPALRFRQPIGIEVKRGC